MKTSELEHLIKMANQIAANVDAGNDEQILAEKIADHLQRFWAKSMRDKITQHARSGGEGLDKAVLRALDVDK